jgi:DNA-binding transcriptional regulator LsrR (DeoR family)
MSSAEQLRLMHLAAEMYYVEDKTQNEIAKELAISRPKVSRLLSQAREEGIVRITVVNPFNNVDSLAKALQDRLGLSAAIVVPGKEGSQEQIRKLIGHAAARFLNNTLQNGDVLGIGWGRTLREVVDAVEPGTGQELNVIPLMGGLGQISPSFQVHEMARILSERLGGLWQALYFPALVEDNAARDALMASRDMARVIQSWRELTVTLVGIGNVDLGPDIEMLFTDYMANDTMEILKQAQAVGDVCMRFFNINGESIDDPMGVISIEHEQLERVPRRIGVAGGREKAKAILGAVAAGLVNNLITDESAAIRILELLD